MKSKQTAVEWLLENLISEPYSEVDFKYNAECWNKAKAMEKEQLRKAYLADPYNAIYGFQQYYNETFKSE